MKTKNEKKSKLYFILKQKSNVPFDPRIELESNPCTESIILFSNLIEIENWQFLVFLFSILNWISKIELIFNFFNKKKN